MKGIGLMVSMMAMEWRHGRGVADIEANTGRVLGMVLEFTGFTQGMCMLGSGRMGRATDVGFIPVKMVVGMLESLNGVSNMALDTTISGMEIDMQESILLIRCTDLESITLLMATGTRVLGMKVKGKALECTLSEMEKFSLAIGKMEFSMSQVHKALPIPSLLLLSTTPRCLMLFRKHDDQQKEHMRQPRWTRE